jgi:hypothetical protein
MPQWLNEGVVGGVLGGVAGGVVVLLLGVVVYLTRSWAAQDGEGRLVFRYHIALRILSTVLFFGTLLMVTVILYFNPPKNEGDVYAIIGVYALFTGLGLPLFWETHFFLMELDDDGLHCTSPWRGKFFIPWAEVRELTWTDIGQYFILKGPDRWFRISQMVAGLSQFLAECEKRLPVEKLQGARKGYTRAGRTFPNYRPERRDVPDLDLGRWSDRPRRRGPDEY